MGVQLGRVSGDHLEKFQAFELSDGGLSINGKIASDDATILNAVAAQIQALSTDVDQPVIPVIFDGNLSRISHLSGFYSVRSSSATIPQGGIASESPVGRWPWSATLVPVPSRGCPAIESLWDAMLRPNDASIVEADVNPFHAVPASTLAYYAANGLSPTTTMTTATGDIGYGYGGSQHLVPLAITWRCRPEDWYAGAATVERLWDGTWLPVVGRDPFLADSSSGWRISNGLVRFGIGPNDDDVFTIECFTGTTWESQTEIRLQADNSPALYFPVIGFTVIRNDPAEVRVRLTCGATAQSSPPMSIDLRLRRGSPLIDMYWSQPGAEHILSQQWAVIFDPVPGSWTTTTPGRYNVADSDGNNLIQFTPTGSVTAASPDTEWSTSIGIIPPSVTPWTYTLLEGAYYGPASEVVRIVGS